MSIRCSSAPSGTRSRLPEERSSTIATRSPRPSRASATCEPMKPAPPVTIAVMAMAAELTGPVGEPSACTRALWAMTTPGLTWSIAR